VDSKSTKLNDWASKNSKFNSNIDLARRPV